MSALPRRLAAFLRCHRRALIVASPVCAGLFLLGRYSAPVSAPGFCLAYG